MSSQDLTKEQRQRIEENKLRALARRAEKVSPVKQIQNEAKPNGFSVVTSFPENNNIEMKLKIETNREKALKKNKMQISIGVKEQPKTAIQGGNFNSQSVVRNINMKVVNEQDTSVRISIKGKTNETKHPSQNYFSNKDSNFGAIDQLNISPNDRDDWATKEMSASMIPKDAFYNSTQKMKGTCILTDNRMFYVDVGYSAPLINFFKQMKTKIYDSTKKVWSFKLEEYNAFMKGVSQFKPEIDIEGLPPWILQTFGSSTSENSIVSEADLKCVDDVLVQTLLPFQKHGVNVAIHRQGRLLIADDMGLGKTLQAICIASYYRNEWPLLVVCPSSVRFDWSQQICKWLPSVPIGEINVVETGKRSAISGLVNIISYDLLSKKTVELNEKRFKVIIMDESHFLKNAKTVRTRAAMPLLKSAKRVLLLSGTPALSRPSELFCQIVGVCPDIVKFHNFGLRYCNAKQMPWGWDYSGSSNMVELQLFLEKKVMIRRQKKDVLSQLPAKTRQVVVLDATSVRKHKGLLTASKLMEKQLKGMERRGVLLQYFHETCKVKLNPVREYLLDLIESEKKFLVFGHHKEMLDNIEDCITSKAKSVKYIRIDGRTSSEQRNFFCREFQSKDDYRVAILSITAANAGLNLCAANLVVFAELFWNPGILVQAEDRVHRIGQADSVSVQYLVARGTADDYIWPLVQDKLNILSKAGLTRDDFSDASTKVMQTMDNSQSTILDLFRSDFIDDSPVIASCSIESLPESEMTASVQAETSKKTTVTNASSPVKKTSPGKKKTPIKFKGPRTELTPTKRQASLTDFFTSTPPKKILRLDDACGKAPEESPEDNAFTENSTQATADISQDDLVVLESVDWDDDL